MSKPALILKSHKIEYETSDIPLGVIKEKYKLSDEDTEGWEKRISETPQTIIIPDIVGDLPDEPEDKPAPPATITDKDRLLVDIDSFKSDIVAYAKELMIDSQHLEVKEVKDLAAMVGNVETSLKGGGNTGPTINILVQNLAEKYQDDC